MTLRMARPFKINGAYFYRRRVPADVRFRVGKEFVKRSLGTRDEAVARARFPAVAAEFEAYFAEVRLGVRTLTHEQCEAIAGEIYAALIKVGGGGRAEGLANNFAWNTFIAGCRAGMDDWVEMERGRMAPQIEFLDYLHGKRVDDHLASRGITVCDRSRRTLLYAVNRAALQASEVVVRQAEGNYTPDPLANRFPVMLGPDPTKSFKALWAEYCKARNKDERKALRAQHFFNSMIEHVGTDDMRAVTEQHLLDWRDKLQASGKLTQQSIKEGYFAHVKAFFGWAKRQKRLPTDPSKEVFIEVAGDAGKDMRGFTDAEAELILGAALSCFKPSMKPDKKMARRWVPWLCAYTGARLNEITQLRPQDIIEESGIWYLDIRPESGTLKTKESRRRVPIHPHLIEMGFIDFVKDRKGAGRVFYDENVHKSPRAAQNLGSKISEWVRGLGIVDPTVAPSHGWRHRFKTKGRACQMNPVYLDAIQGHAPRTEGEKYGMFPVEVLVPEILKYPRYEVKPLENVDGRSRQAKDRKKAMAGREIV